QPALDFLNRNRSVLDAHNCYPYNGSWGDRIDRALKTGFPVGIEQDLTWGVDPATGKAPPLLSHPTNTPRPEPTPPPPSSAPARAAYVSDRVRPIGEKALAENDRARWPLIILHFDFKSQEPELLGAIWELLGEYESWITTARKTTNTRDLARFEPKPLLVLTEDSDAQENVFFGKLK